MSKRQSRFRVHGRAVPAIGTSFDIKKDVSTFTPADALKIAKRLLEEEFPRCRIYVGKIKLLREID